MRDDYKCSIAVYLRKSRSDPDDESIDDTLSRHMDTILSMSKKSGLNITEIYREVVSGSTLFARPEMLRLLNDIESGKYTGVACMDIDRLGRSSQKDTGIILETLKDNNTVIITPSKIYDLNDDFDEQSVEMQSFIARQEYRSITRRLRRGTIKSCEYGYHVSDIPFGYERTYINRHPSLKPVPEQAEAVKMIFDMYVNHNYGSSAIADKLNTLNIKPRKGTSFSRTTVRFILKNPIYTGKIVWNRCKHIKKKSPFDKCKTTLNPKSEWIESQGIHQPIISQELFDAAQKIAKSRAHPPANSGELKNVFSGLLRCSNCKSAIVRRGSSSCAAPPRLLCPVKGCTSGIIMSAVEDLVINIIKEIIPDLTETIAEKTIENLTARKTSYLYAVRQAQKALQTFTSQRMKLYDLLEQGVYDTETFTHRNETLLQKINAAEQELTKCENMLNDISQTSNSITVPDLTTLWNYYNYLSPSEKNQIYKKLITCMYYSRSRTQKHNTFNLDIEFSFDI